MAVFDYEQVSGHCGKSSQKHSRFPIVCAYKMISFLRINALFASILAIILAYSSPCLAKSDFPANYRIIAQYPRIENDLDSQVWDIKPSPDGSKIAVAVGPYAQGRIELLDKKTGNLLWRGEHPNGQANVLSFSPDGRMLASGGFNRRGKIPGEVRLWNVLTGKLVRTLAVHTGNVYSLDFSPNNNTVAVGSGDGRIRIWSSKTGEIEKIFSAGGYVTSLAFSADGALLASANWRAKVSLWNVKAGNLWGQLPNEDRIIYAVAFSPDGKEIVTASNAFISLYKAREKRLLWTKEIHYGFNPPWERDKGSLMFSPKGDIVAVSGLPRAGFHRTEDGVKIRELGDSMYLASNLVISTTSEIFAVSLDSNGFNFALVEISDTEIASNPCNVPYEKYGDARLN